MLAMTIIGSHALSQALVEVCHRLVQVFLWQLSETVSKTTFDGNAMCGIQRMLQFHKWAYDLRKI